MLNSKDGLLRSFIIDHLYLYTFLTLPFTEFRIILGTVITHFLELAGLSYNKTIGVKNDYQTSKYSSSESIRPPAHSRMQYYINRSLRGENLRFSTVFPRSTPHYVVVSIIITKSKVMQYRFELMPAYVVTGNRFRSPTTLHFLLKWNIVVVL